MTPAEVLVGIDTVQASLDAAIRHEEAAQGFMLSHRVASLLGYALAVYTLQEKLSAQAANAKLNTRFLAHRKSMADLLRLIAPRPGPAPSVPPGTVLNGCLPC